MSDRKRVRLYTVEQLAKITGLHPNTIRVWAKRLKVKKYGTVFLFTKKEKQMLINRSFVIRGLQNLTHTGKNIVMSNQKMKEVSYSVGDVAKILNVSRQRVYKIIERKNNPLPYKIINNHIRILKKDLKKFLSEGSIHIQK